MIYYLAIMVALVIIELVYIRYAGPYILDLPNHRSSHVRPTVRGGGVVFYFGIVAYFFLSHFTYPYFFVGVTIITTVSFLDDIKGLHQSVRLVAHLSALMLMTTELALSGLPVWGWVIVIIVAAGIVNAYNFMDGINGITAVYSLIALGTFWFIDTRVVDFIDQELLISTSLAVLVFSFFNFRKRALCFAGDVGAVCIAFVIIFLLAKLILVTNDISYILILGVYGVDTVGTILERLVKRENIFDAHRSHLYQLLVNESGWPHLLVSALYGVVQLSVNVALLMAFTLSPVIVTLLLLLVLIVVFALLKVKVFRVFR